MKLNRKWFLVIALVLSLTMATAGTLAYLTDRDSEANVFTVGNVEIDLKEDFEQGATLFPGINIEKKPTITNTGSNDAWVWAEIAIPSALNDTTSASKNAIHFNMSAASVADGLWNWWNGAEYSEGAYFIRNEKIDEIDYDVYIVLYETALKPGETTEEPVIYQVYLDPHVDIDPDGNWALVNNGEVTKLDWNSEDDGNPVIYVSAYAMQTEGFKTVYEAYEAYNDQWGDKGTEWGDPSAALADTWDGTADTSWYDPANPKTAYTITTAEQLAGISELVSGNTTFDGVTFTLGKDIDLYCEDTSASADGDPVTFRPIGDKKKNGTFEGVFDGNGKTIKNLYQNGWDLGYEWGVYGSYGLFGNVNNATIKNLNLTGGESYIEGGDVSCVAGSATGTCVFENITIKDTVAATYNNGNGGIIGWSGAGNYTFKDITIAEDVVLAGLWGSFDSSIGGIVGQGEPGATYNFENVEINCRIDAYNDCTASYDYYNYRMCGMIIGRLEETTTIDGKNYPDTSKYNITCNNVTVNYGDWMNYHYCEPTPSNMNGGRGMRVEPGYAYDGLPADYDHSQCVDNHMNLIPFDQIFGGAQINVKGLKAYTGVTVNYPD